MMIGEQGFEFVLTGEIRNNKGHYLRIYGNSKNSYLILNILVFFELNECAVPVQCFVFTSSNYVNQVSVLILAI